MIQIELDNVSKRFFFEWVFRKISLTIPPQSKLAILGSNGTGKSTLLKIISGFMVSSKGTIQYSKQGKIIPQDEIYTHLSLAAPYVELIEELTFSEMIDFQFKFKSFQPNIDKAKLIDRSQLKKAKNKPLKYFSSGMRMRAKLALALCADTSFVILDEPTSNLDAEGVAWYQELVADFAAKRTILVGSNDEREYAFCDTFLNVEDYKGKQK